MRILLLVAAALACLTPAHAQGRAETERRLTGLRGQIRGVEQQVQNVRSEEASAVEALGALGTEIALREQLLGGYRTQIETIRSETGTLQSSIGRLEGEIRLAQSSYRDRARHAYMHGRRNALALILSAGSFNQMVVRARYLQQFAARRRRQVERIAEQTAELRAREGAVRESLEATQRLLSQSQAEQMTLQLRRRERAALVVSARSRRSDLERQLSQRRADARDLEGIVQSIVSQDRRRAEAERARVAAAEAQRQTAARQATEAAARAETSRQADLQRQADAAARRAAQRRDLRVRPTPRRDAGPTTPFPTPVPAPPPVAAARPATARPAPRRAPTREAPVRTAPAPEPRPAPRTAPAPRRAEPAAPVPSRAEPSRAEPVREASADLSGSFRQNRGRLPWPADGTLTGTFGTRTDPDYGTSIQSIGIDLSTQPGAPSRAVFDGTVERVGTMATYGTFVMVSHGDFTTIYGNLSEVVVSRGQTIRAGQVVGRAGTATDRRGSQLFFALFQGGRPVNPTEWLRSR